MAPRSSTTTIASGAASSSCAGGTSRATRSSGELSLITQRLRRGLALAAVGPLPRPLRGLRLAPGLAARRDGILARGQLRELRPELVQAIADLPHLLDGDAGLLDELREVAVEQLRSRELLHQPQELPQRALHRAGDPLPAAERELRVAELPAADV